MRNLTFKKKKKSRRSYTSVLCEDELTRVLLSLPAEVSHLPFSWLYATLFHCCADKRFFCGPFLFVNPAGDPSPFPLSLNWGLGLERPGTSVLLAVSY